jgi:AraC family ethanolamine operon transcriptional activator
MRMFDPEHLRDAFGGQINHRLLGPGTFTAHLLRLNMAQFVLEVVRYSLPVAITGHLYEGRVALAFGLNVPQGTLVSGHPHHSGALAFFDDAAVIDARLSAGTEWAILILERNHFESELSRFGARGAIASNPAGVPLNVPEPVQQRLGNLLRAVTGSPGLASQLLQIPGAAAALEQQLLATYAKAFATADTPQSNGRGSLQRRHRLVRKAEKYVFAHLDESVRMDKLCREVGASARSLEYAFQAVYGMGAMQYLRTVRLNEVRKVLLQSNDSAPATVTATAMDWGFWHLGEFAAAYRRLFGEVPSETLRCRHQWKATDASTATTAATAKPQFSISNVDIRQPSQPALAH